MKAEKKEISKGVVCSRESALLQWLTRCIGGEENRNRQFVLTRHADWWSGRPHSEPTGSHGSRSSKRSRGVVDWAWSAGKRRLVERVSCQTSPIYKALPFLQRRWRSRQESNSSETAAAVKTRSRQLLATIQQLLLRRLTTPRCKVRRDFITDLLIYLPCLQKYTSLEN